MKDDLDIPAHPAQALLVGTGQILALKRTVPSVGSMSRIMVRARVDFPQPDSPTMPRVSPLPNGQGDVVYGFDVLGGLGKTPLRTGNHFFRWSAWSRIGRSDMIAPPFLVPLGRIFPALDGVFPIQGQEGGCFWVQIFRQQAQRL